MDTDIFWGAVNYHPTITRNAPRFLNREASLIMHVSLKSVRAAMQTRNVKFEPFTKLINRVESQYARLAGNSRQITG